MNSLIVEQGEAFDPKKYLQPGLTEMDVIQIKEVFDEYDSQKKGFLNPFDIRFKLLKEGFNAKKDTIFHIISEYDEEELGMLSFQDFVKMCANKNPPNETRNQIRYSNEF